MLPCLNKASLPLPVQASAAGTSEGTKSIVEGGLKVDSRVEVMEQSPGTHTHSTK